MKTALTAFLVVILFALVGFSFYQYQKIQRLASDVSLIRETLQIGESVVTLDSSNTQKSDQSSTESCGASCKEAIKNEVASAVSNISITPYVTSTQSSPKTAAKQISFVPLAGGSTVSTDWVTLDDSAVSIDLLNDYGSSATVSWEASLKVANANGSAFARLYDATNNIAVDGSEIKTDNNGFFQIASSKNLPFWRGRNTYKVQIKSLNGNETTISGAKLKVQY